MNTKEIPALPDILKNRKMPSLARWAMGKFKTYREEENEGSPDCPPYTSRGWYFEGNFYPRRGVSRVKQHSDNWEEGGNEYAISITPTGGTYIGQPQRVYVCFTEYVVHRV